MNYPLLPATGTLLNIFRLHKLKTSISRLEFKGKIYNFWILWFSSELIAKEFSKKIIMFLYYLCVFFSTNRVFSTNSWSFSTIRVFGKLGTFPKIRFFSTKLGTFPKIRFFSTRLGSFPQNNQADCGVNKR